MTLVALIDHDCKCLKVYFQALFDLLRQAEAEDLAAPVQGHDIDAVESQATYHRFSHLLKPDMVLHTYSLADYWLMTICEDFKRRYKITQSYKAKKREDQLAAYHRFLTTYVKVDLEDVEDSYKSLDDLRIIRNAFIHSGGHISPEKAEEYSRISGIALALSLIVVNDRFIWSSLEHARIYLCAAATSGKK